MKTYINLTNGLEANSSPPNVLRIQSTKCEQKLWQDVIDSLPDDLLWELVNGRSVTIIDNSEKPRISRALWQGAALGYFALMDGLDIPNYKKYYGIFPRGNREINLYKDFQFQIEFLNTKRYSYYKKFYSPTLGKLHCVDKTFEIVYSIDGNKLIRKDLEDVPQ